MSEKSVETLSMTSSADHRGSVLDGFRKNSVEKEERRRRFLPGVRHEVL